MFVAGVALGALFFMPVKGCETVTHEQTIEFATIRVEGADVYIVPTPNKEEIDNDQTTTIRR